MRGRDCVHTPLVPGHWQITVKCRALVQRTVGTRLDISRGLHVS